MHFQQLNSIIPVFDHITVSRTSQIVESSPQHHKLIVVQSGHLTLSGLSLEPIVFTQGYACPPQYGTSTIQVPKTKEAEYMIITYRVLPELSEWTLKGPLRTVSEIKIKYMLDELVRTAGAVCSDAEEEAAQQFRKRLLMERILYIFMYETRLSREEHSTAAAIESSLSYMSEHYMLKLTLSMLAERAGMSEGHYTVLFKRHTGVTMTQYLRRVRLDKAKEMLRQTRLSAKDIAQRVGFSDYFHFSRMFKREEGCSPTAFQHRMKE